MRHRTKLKTCIHTDISIMDSSTDEADMAILINVASGFAEHLVAYIFVVACALQDLPGRPNAFVCTSVCFEAMPKQNV